MRPAGLRPKRKKLLRKKAAAHGEWAVVADEPVPRDRMKGDPGHEPRPAAAADVVDDDRSARDAVDLAKEALWSIALEMVEDKRGEDDVEAPVRVREREAIGRPQVDLGEGGAGARGDPHDVRVPVHGLDLDRKAVPARPEDDGARDIGAPSGHIEDPDRLREPLDQPREALEHNAMAPEEPVHALEVAKARFQLPGVLPRKLHQLGDAREPRRRFTHGSLQT